MRVALVHHQWGFVTLAALTASTLGCGGGETAAPVASNPPQGASSVGAAAGMAPMAGMTPTPAAGAHNPHGAMMAQHGATPATGIPGVPATTPGATTPMPTSAHAGGAADPAAMMRSVHGAPAGTPTTTPAATPTPTAPAASAHAGGTAAPNTPMPIANATTPAAIPGAGHAGGTAIPGAAPTTPAAANPGATVAPDTATTTPAGEGAAAHAAAGGNTIPAQPGVNPGQPGVNPGQPGEGVQGASGASAITGEPGSIDFVLSKLIAMAKSGDYTGIESIISDKAKGLAATFREQDLKPTQIEAYKVTFDGLQPLNQRAAGSTGRMFTLKKGETFVQITVAKENGSFKIKEMQIRDGKVK